MMPIPLDFVFSDETLAFVLDDPEQVTDAECIAENPDEDRPEN